MPPLKKPSFCASKQMFYTHTQTTDEIWVFTATQNCAINSSRICTLFLDFGCCFSKVNFAHVCRSPFPKAPLPIYGFESQYPYCVVRLILANIVRLKPNNWFIGVRLL